jgi:LysR family transcriptional regulator, glycine cleavage system transcriptional activator
MAAPSRPTPLPPLRALQAFEAVARRGNISGAAAELGVSSSAISQQIRTLEQVLGLTIVQREGRGIGLTDAGRRYSPGVTSAFEALREAQKVIERAKLDSVVVISAPASIALRWLAPRLTAWASARPGLCFQLQDSDREPNLEVGEADLRITYGKHVQDHRHFTRLFTDAVAPACSPKFLSEFGPLICGEQISALPLIGIDWGPQIDGPPPGWPEWMSWIGVETPLRRPALSFSLSSAAIDAAVAGKGVVLAQLSMIEAELDAKRLVLPFESSALSLPKPYYIAWATASPAKGFCLDLKQWLVKSACSYQAPPPPNRKLSDTENNLTQ